MLSLLFFVLSINRILLIPEKQRHATLSPISFRPIRSLVGGSLMFSCYRLYVVAGTSNAFVRKLRNSLPVSSIKLIYRTCTSCVLLYNIRVSVVGCTWWCVVMVVQSISTQRDPSPSTREAMMRTDKCDCTFEVECALFLQQQKQLWSATLPYTRDFLSCSSLRNFGDCNCSHDTLSKKAKWYSRCMHHCCVAK